MFTIRVNGRALKHIIKGTKNYEIRLKRGVFNNITYDMPIKLFNGEISTIKSLLKYQLKYYLLEVSSNK